MRRFFHVDVLEGGIIEHKTFDDYWKNSMTVSGLWLDKNEFNLLKEHGNLVFGNIRSENELVAKSVLEQLKRKRPLGFTLRAIDVLQLRFSSFEAHLVSSYSGKKMARIRVDSGEISDKQKQKYAEELECEVVSITPKVKMSKGWGNYAITYIELSISSYHIEKRLLK